ncbi:MAG: serine hydrolase domain-containing protein [Acidobacteriota bacterium]
MSLEATVVSLLRGHCDDSGPGASAGVIVDGQLRVAESVGLADLENSVPASSATNYRLASVSKQFTASAILLLAEQSLLRLADSIVHFLPELPSWCAPVTVAHLLNHTSGVPDYEALIDAGTVVPLVDADVLSLIATQSRPMFPAGTQFHYSNSAYALLAQTVARVSGIPFEEFLRERIFLPAGMSGSLAHVQGTSFVADRAFGYSRTDDGSFRRSDQSLTSGVLGDGGVYSSVDDLARWERALLRGDVLSDALKDLAWNQPVATGERGVGYGLGWYTGTFGGEPTVYHTGDSIGFRTYLERFPRKRIAVVLLMNRTRAEVLALGREISLAALEC